MNDLKKMEEVAIKAAKEAGNKILEMQGNVKEVRKDKYYESASLVTEADLASEKVIVEHIKKEFPDHGIYAEEESKENLEADYVWYVDPLDGTANFSRGTPFFGISIGVIHAGESVVGVLYFPALNLIVNAHKGSGAYANGKKSNVSNRSMERSMYFTSGIHKGKNHVNSSLVKHVGMLRVIDETSYALALIAMGGAEIYYMINLPHDVVAGVCIVNEAGGKVTDGNGEPWSLDSAKVLVTNSVVHEDVLRAVKND